MKISELRASYRAKARIFAFKSKLIYLSNDGSLTGFKNEISIDNTHSSLMGDPLSVSNTELVALCQGGLEHWHFNGKWKKLKTPKIKPSEFISLGYHSQCGYILAGLSQLLQITADSKVTLDNRFDYYSQVEISPEAKKIACLAWNHDTLTWDIKELIVVEQDSGGQFKKLNISKVNAPEAGFSHVGFLDEDTLYLVARHENRQAIWLYNFQRKTWRPLISSSGFFISFSCLFQWRESLVFSRDLKKFFIIQREKSLTSLISIDPELDDKQVLIDAKLKLNITQLICLGSEIVFEYTSYNSTANIELLSNIDRLEASKLPEIYQLPGAHALVYPSPNHKAYIILLHSGPYSEVLPTWPDKAKYFNQRGYTSIHLNFLGSSGQLGSESILGNWGRKEVENILECIDELARRLKFERKDLFLWAGAAGAFSLAKLLTKADFAGAILVYPYFDLDSIMENLSYGYKDYLQKLISKDEIVSTKEVLEYWQDLCHAPTPCLFFHGKKDRLVDWKSTQLIHQQRLANEKNSYAFFYEDVAHSFESIDIKLRYYEQVEYFLEKQLEF